MQWDDLKYLLAFLLPASFAFSLYLPGIWTFSTLLLAFVILPAIEFFLRARPGNYAAEVERKRDLNPLFDILLYLNIPILFGLLALFLVRISNVSYTWIEFTGLTLGMGVVIGTVGINVAHELGHRPEKVDQWMAKAMLIPALYMHFFIEHNRGHHRNVGTQEDPATARKGESLYAFWWRSVRGSYRHAWQLEFERLHRLGLPKHHLSNAMIQFTVVHALYLIAVLILFGVAAMGLVTLAGIVGFLLLETVNYVEHYGLMRKKLGSGRYEVVGPQHSWNSDHELGRIFLYELTRHSDHHLRSTRKYQILRHQQDSPQLPFGYPAAMVLSMLPFAWFHIIDRRLPT